MRGPITNRAGGGLTGAQSHRTLGYRSYPGQSEPERAGEPRRLGAMCDQSFLEPQPAPLPLPGSTAEIPDIFDVLAGGEDEGTVR